MIPIKNIFDLIKGDPDGFLGHPSCSKLEAFLSGWTTAGIRYGSVGMPKDGGVFSQIVEFMLNKHKLPPLNANIYSIARLVSRGDHAAFYLFYEDMDEFSSIHKNYFTDVSSPNSNGTINRSELILHIKRRPETYLGCKSVSRFLGYLKGYEYARLQSFPNSEKLSELADFEKWLAAKEGFPASILTEAIFLQREFDNEDRAFDLCLKEWNIWERHTGESIERANGEM